MKEYIDKERVTINLQRGLINKLDLLRYGSESWNSFLEKAYPVLFEWRRKDIEKRLNEQ